jgi:hypothetical protein
MELKIDSMGMESSLSKMTDEELCKIKDTVSQILETRYFQKKEKDWLALKDAIANYCKNYGSIDICGEYDNLTINSTDDFSTIGEISFREF